MTEEKGSQIRGCAETQRLANTRKYFHPWARGTMEGGSVAWTQRLGSLSAGSWSHGWDTGLLELTPKAGNEERHPHPSPPPGLLISLLCLPLAKLSHRYGSLRNADHVDQPSPPTQYKAGSGRAEKWIWGQTGPGHAQKQGLFIHSDRSVRVRRKVAGCGEGKSLRFEERTNGVKQLFWRTWIIPLTF